jgi:hypothetical protein
MVDTNNSKNNPTQSGIINHTLPFATADVSQQVEIRFLSKDGHAALPPATITEHWKARTATSAMANQPALHYKANITGKVRTWVLV